MAIGDDVKKAFQEVGASYVVKRDSGNLSGEYLVYDIPVGDKNAFMFDASLAYDTVVVEGDVLELVDGRKVLVANKTPDIFQDETIVFETFLFKCNVPSGEIFRSSGETWNSEYHKDRGFSSIKSGIDGVLVEVSGNQLINSEELSLLSIKRLEMYVSSGENIQILDRIQIRSGEYYQVNVIKNHLCPAINVLELSEDTR